MTSKKKQRTDDRCPVEFVDILGHRFRIAHSCDLSDEELGRCETTHQVLVINERQGGDSIRDTLLHEVQHAIANLVGFTPSESAPPEEDYIARMTTGLRCVMLQNPAFCQWVFSR